MDEISNKYNKYAEYSEESRTLIKDLMKMYFKNNFIRYTLTNIMSIDEKQTK